MRITICISAGACAILTAVAATNDLIRLDNVLVEGSALSQYRPETVRGGTFTDLPPEELPCTVDTLTEDFIAEHNPTDLHDLMRYVPGIESGGKSLLIRTPGTFSIRGKGGTEPAFDGVVGIGSGAGLFLDPFLLDRVEVVKGPIASLAGGAGATQNAQGAGGAVNLYLKSASLEGDRSEYAGNVSIGHRTWRQRGMADINETLAEDRAAFRVVATEDVYSPAYINQGGQDGARPKESFTVAPSLVFRPSESVTAGLKTMFQYVDQPGYVGVPVYRGHPGADYGWYDSSCARGDRAQYRGFYLNPWADWQVTDDWLLKFGAAMMWNSWDFVMREPFTPGATSGYPTTADQMFAYNYYYSHGYWPGGERYSYTGFSEGDQLNRGYNLYVRSIYDKELPLGLRNCLMVQPDYYYRESNGGFGVPTSRYGLTLQDSISWGMVTLLGGVRYDHFEQNAYTSDAGKRYFHSVADAVSPRVGLTVRPLDWLVLFANWSETRTPTLGYINAAGEPAGTSPWIARQYESGVRLKTAERLWLTVSAYRIEQENSPVVDRTGLFQTYDGRNTSYGAEVSASGEITPDWTMLAMYAYNHYIDRNVATLLPGRDFERTPAHVVTLNTSYRIHGLCDALDDIVVGGGFRYRSMSYGTLRGTYVHKNCRYDQSFVFDVNITVPLAKFGASEAWTLTLGVRNLFGEKYFESYRHWHESLAGEPRTFEIGIRARF